MMRTTFLTGLMGMAMLLGAVGVSNAAEKCAAKDCKCTGCEKDCKEKCACHAKQHCGEGHCGGGHCK